VSGVFARPFAIQPKPDMSQPLLSEFPVFRISGKAIEQSVVRDTRRSFEELDDSPKPILDFGKLLRIFNIICNIWNYQLTVLDFNDHLSAFRHADAQSREIGCSERSHRRIYRFFRIFVGHWVKGICPSRPLIMRISRRRRRECLKHLSQEEDKLVTEWFSKLIMTNRWTHILSSTAFELQSLWLCQAVAANRNSCANHQQDTANAGSFISRHE
jgi:hypothetical protein